MNIFKKITFSLFILPLLALQATAQITRIDYDRKNPNIRPITYNSGANVPAVTTTVKETPVQGQGLREWTVLMYMNGKNNLELYALMDFNSIEKVGSTDKVAFVAELGRSQWYESADGDWYGSRRYLIQKDDDERIINSPVLYDNPNSDMGSSAQLVDFVKWGKKNYPAKRYLLIIWNHGSGWKSKLRKTTLPAGLSIDEDTGNHIAIPELGKAFSQFGPVDVYGVDACLMQMLSVNYEIKDYAKYIVASEDLEPAGGFNYEDFCGFLVNNPNAYPKRVAEQIVDTYINYYALPNKPVTMSAIETAGLTGLLKRTDALAQALMENGRQKDIRMIVRKTITFFETDYRDLYVFAQGVMALNDPKVSAAAQEVINHLQNKVVIRNGYVGSKYKNIGGLSVYLSVITYDRTYNELAFAKNGKWGEFVKWLNTNLDR